jgi:long-subunit acyl-CoA synthetase (AMP-forming)
MFKKVREQALGNTLVFLISGGALINEKYLRMLNGLGYSIHNGYGLTESGIVSVELSKKANKRNLTSVGIPFPNVLWRKTDDGTLEIKSDLVYKSQLHHGVTTSFNKDD